VIHTLPKNGKRAIALTTVFSILSFSPGFAAQPDVGEVLGSLQNNQVVVPGKEAPTVKAPAKKDKKAPKDQGPKFHVTSVRITGQNVISEVKLAKLVKHANNKDLTLSELNEIADHVTKFFHEQGYMVATAYVPPQSIKDGVAEIRVVVGKYGSIQVKNEANFSTKKVNGFLSRLKTGDYVKKSLLERALLILNDVSGLSAKATLSPGKEPGTTDVTVEVSDTQKIVFSAGLDNYGNSYLGYDRLSINGAWRNVSGFGDEIRISELDGGSGFNNLQVAYLLPLGTQGGVLDAEFAHVNYYLGGKFKSLAATGYADVSSLYYATPIVRSRKFNVYSRIGFVHKQLYDRINTLTDSEDSTLPYTNDKEDNILSIGLIGNKYDDKGSGVTSMSLGVERGQLSLNTQSILDYDNYYTHTNGRFYKIKFDAQRQKYFAKRLSYFAKVNIQHANKNLDSSEKIYLGGPNGVRAYPTGDASGDSGTIVTGEIRYDLPNPDLQFATFIDNGRITLNEKPWTTTSNTTQLTGAGFGFIWNKAKDYYVRLDFAWRLTDPQYGDKATNGLVWLQSVKYF